MPDAENPFARLMSVEVSSGAAPTPNRSHSRAFCAWLSLTLREQAAEVEKYLADDPHGVRASRVAAVAAEGENSRLVPPRALDAERQLFLADLRVVLRLLGVGGSLQTDGGRGRVIFELLESPLLSRLGLQDFAETCAISADWLRKWFKHAVGDSFPALCGRARLKRATRVLRTSGARVEDAAAAAGYVHSPDFYRDFKSRMGATPGGYRRHWRRIHCPDCPEQSGTCGCHTPRHCRI